MRIYSRSGTAKVNATLRGSLRDPQMNGRMEFKDASFYMNDVPNGVDNASGTILFDRNRATIENLTAETGGGRSLSTGFWNLATSDLSPAGRREPGRVRYPEDVSFTSNAQLALNGTSDASTLSGTVTLNRAAISAGADLPGCWRKPPSPRLRRRIPTNICAACALTCAWKARRCLSSKPLSRAM